MFHTVRQRTLSYAILLTVTGFLYFANLGAPSLWDIDEGNNAEAAREMLASGNWIVPTFNFQLRTDKPALLYWLQLACYRLFGVNELAARLPSAVAAVVSVLLTYELGRMLYGPATGLLAGLMLASSVLFCAAARFANPDALLSTCSLLTLVFFTVAHRRRRPAWLIAAGVSAGLATLAKGPVGLVLPLAAITLFLCAARDLRFLRTRYFFWSSAAYTVVVLPWYTWVAVDTRLEFLRGFILTHNLGRFQAPMEGHRGPFWYYALCVLVGFAPWCIFLLPLLWDAARDIRRRLRNGGAPDTAAEESPGQHPALLFTCWIMTYLVFFSLSGTKLPNYVLPVYAPLALLTARLLSRWRVEASAIAQWQWALSLTGLAAIGIGFALGLIFVAGRIELPRPIHRQYPDLARYALFGSLPMFAAAGAAWCLRRQARSGVIVALTLGGVLFVGSVAAWASAALDAHKAPRYLASTAFAGQTERDIRVAAYDYFQPSLVFYCRREVVRLKDDAEAAEFLRSPLEVYLFVPAGRWRSLRHEAPAGVHVVARHEDLYQNREIVVVSNRA